MCSRIAKRLRKLIKTSGPIPLAEYIQEVLTGKDDGYYMKNDVFGPKGDFITSPEISQAFGEMLAVWGVHETLKIGAPNTMQLVELGPGRGTLADDMLRSLSKIGEFNRRLSMHLVEVSPAMRQLQAEKLCGEESNSLDWGSRVVSARSKHGPFVYWYYDLDEVPKDFSYFVANELLDALPIHAFIKTYNGWREVLVDSDDALLANGRPIFGFKYVLSEEETPMCTELLKDFEGDSRTHLEVCPKAGKIVRDLSERIQRHGGLALLADYGHFGTKMDTFRAFKDHKLCDPLRETGLCDLTADVDFSFVKKMSGTLVSSFGPVTQRDFLHRMGIQLRLEVLHKNASAEVRKSLNSGYHVLTDPLQMGERFKFFAITQKTDQTPAGFSDEC